MEISRPALTDVDRLAALFDETFTAAEGAEEGALIGRLAREIFETTAPEDLYGFVAAEEEGLAGCILFTRLRFAEEARTVFLMAPVAVGPGFQRQGLGQRLIAHGLAELRAQGVDIVLTYGDPAYYAKTGFAAIDETVAQAPMPLTFPHGWLGQSLTDQPIGALRGASRCVPAFNKPDLW